MRPVVALLLFVGMAAGLQGNESMYIRIVYGSVDMSYATQKGAEQHAILNHTTHEVLCFDFYAPTLVGIYSDSLSGSCLLGFVKSYTISDARETIVGSGPDGDITMTIVSAPPPTPGPAPFPSYPNMYFRIVYGSVDMVYVTYNTERQYVVLNNYTREVFCFSLEKDIGAIADVVIYSDSFSGSCTGEEDPRTIYAAWETDVGSGPDGDLSMTIVSAPPLTPGPAPIPSYSNMYLRIVYGSVDTVFETQKSTENYYGQNLILNYTTHEVLCFHFSKKAADIAEVIIYSESFSGSCAGTWSGWVQIYEWTTVVGSGPDGDLSMTIVSAPPLTPGPAPFPSYPNMYFRIVYGSVDMVYETQNNNYEQHVILNHTKYEALCFSFVKATDDIAEVTISSESLSGSCSGDYKLHTIYDAWETVVGSGPDGNLSMMVVSAPTPAPTPTPTPTQPMYFRIVYGSVDMVYESQNTTYYQYVILNSNSTHGVLCFSFKKDTDDMAEVNIDSESFSGSCSGLLYQHTIYAARETVVGSGPDGDLSMTIVSAPPPTPGPAPFPSYPNLYFRIVYGSVDMVYETQKMNYQYLILNHSTHEVLCFGFNKRTDDIAEVIIYSESFSGSCTGDYKWDSICAAWETVVGSGPDGDLSMIIVAAPPTPAPTATPAPTPAPTPPPTATPTPTQPSSNMYLRIVYGNVDMVYETQNTTEQNLILNYTTHEVLCFNFNEKTDDTAEVIIYSESFSGSCTGTYPGWVQIYDWTTVVGSGPDGNISMTIVSAPTPAPAPTATAHPPTATPTAAPTATPTAHPLTAGPTPSPGSDDKLEIILIVLSATIVVILLVLAIMMYKSRHPPVPPITPVVDEDPIQTGLLPESRMCVQ